MRLLGAAARVGCALLVSGAGCTLLMPLDDLQGQGGGDAAPGDVAVEGSGDVGAETGPDTGSGADSAAGSEAASDSAMGTEARAEAEAEAAPGSYCASLSPQPSFCADFDQGPFNTGFPVLNEPGSGDLGADSQYSVSAPNSMYAQIAQGASSGHTYAYAERSFTSTAAGADFAFDIRPVSVTANASAVMAKIGLDLGLPTEHALALVLSTNDGIEESFFAADGGEVFLEHDFAPVLQVGQWTRIEIVLDLTHGTVAALADGTQVLAPSPLDASWPTSTSTLAIDVGFGYANTTTSAWVARYDDVVVTLM